MKSLLCSVMLAALPLGAEVKIAQHENRISIEIDGKPYTDLFYGPDAWKPYLHPLRAATGTVVTRYYPMETVEGESTDHPHHKGLWFGHGEVNGFDFWSNEPKYNKKDNLGRIVMKKVGKLQSGAKSGTVNATFEWQDPQGHPLLTETRRMTFYGGKDERVIDFDINLDPLAKVTFGDTKEGTFALRLASGLETPQPKSLKNPLRTGTMVNSEGGKGEDQCWGKRANWMDYYGELKGEKVGIAILDHPQNPLHPTYWHTRAYGLFAANIFGVRDFTSDRSANGNMTIEPGHALRFRYRVIIHPGDSASAGIAKRWGEYAAGKPGN